jgi:ribosomal protein S11
MQKQQKKRKLLNKTKKTFWNKKKKKHSNYLQKCIKNSGRPFFNITLNSLSKKDSLKTNISLFPNNVFCSLENLGQKKTICQASSGKYKIKVSKKSLKYASKIVITNFFRELKQKKIAFSKPHILVLVSPSNLRKRILLNIFKLLKYVKNRRFIVKIKPKKVFNGCRVKKQIRKKQKRYAIYK